MYHRGWSAEPLSVPFQTAIPLRLTRFFLSRSLTLPLEERSYIYIIRFIFQSEQRTNSTRKLTVIMLTAIDVEKSHLNKQMSPNHTYTKDFHYKMKSLWQYVCEIDCLTFIQRTSCIHALSQGRAGVA